MVLAGIWEKRNRRRHIAQGFEQGKTIGLEQGREEGREEGVEQGETLGREEALDEGIARGKTLGREEALAESNNAWRDWVQRKEAAAASGIPFDEPMPDSNGHRNTAPSNLK